MNDKDFGQWFKGLRNECGYTQRELAQLLGFDKSQSIANIESGNVSLPKKVYKKVIELFRLDPERFIDLVMKLEKEKIKKAIYTK
jgi:DNA-binding XRE family transcriptional regulator